MCHIETTGIVNGQVGQLIKLTDAQQQTKYSFHRFSIHSLFDGEYQLPFYSAQALNRV
jgi:hypothetical protein